MAFNVQFSLIWGLVSTLVRTQITASDGKMLCYVSITGLLPFVSGVVTVLEDDSRTSPADFLPFLPLLAEEEGFSFNKI